MATKRKTAVKYYNREFAYWARSEIRNLGITQRIVADRIGVSPCYISAFICGRNEIRKRDVIAFCYAFSCSERADDVWKRVKFEYESQKAAEDYKNAAANFGRKESVQRQKRNTTHADVERRTRRSTAQMDNSKNKCKLHAN